MELSERKRRILRAVVEIYIETAEPVGSKAVLERSGLSVSSATVRSEMAELEAMELLEQPHTSAGRVPAPKGYRLYVNDLMEEHRLSAQETERLNDALHLKMRELDRVMDEAGRIVSQLTKYPAFALSTGAQRVTIKRFNLLMVDEFSFIAVVMTNNNVVENKLFRLPNDLTEAQLQMLNTLLNSSFTDLTLEEITPELMRMASQAVGEAYGLISLVVSFAMEILEEQQGRLVRTAGVTRLLSHPEYKSLEKAEPIMSFLSDTEHIEGLAIPEGESTRVLIGPENVHEALKDSSVVLASYDIGGDMKGVIGVVGPTRMDYATILARLQYFANGLSQLFGQNQLPQGSDKEGS